jgi:hypothetical protein
MDIEFINQQSPNFFDEEGRFFLVKCHACKRENYSPYVASGFCAWCGADKNAQGGRSMTDKSAGAF